MTDYGRCQYCHGYGWIGSHECPPQWIVHDPDAHGDDRMKGETVYAMAAAEAAEKYAEESDCESEYPLLQGEILTVSVRMLYASGADPWETWHVTGESVPQYSATDTKP